MAFNSRLGVRLCACVSALSLMTGCAISPSPYTAEEKSAQSSADMIDMFKGGEPLTGPMTLSDAIARAIKYNLDRRSRVMEQALALGQLDVDSFELLPKLAANAGYSERSQNTASGSRDLYSQANSTSAPSYSSDRWSKTYDLTMSWNILDFGLTYYTAKSNADRALIANERRRKASQNLITDVRFAFWRAAAYQYLKSDVDQLVKEVQTALEQSRAVENENLRSPVDALRYQKSLLETVRQLILIQQELSTASLELAALINVPPGTDIVLTMPEVMVPPSWDMPLDKMEEVAFVRNPDIAEQSYLSRIAVDDTRKAIIRLLPGITFSAGDNGDLNKFLIYKNWYETGAKLSWNLVNLASGPTILAQSDANEAITKQRRLAVRMAVLAQVNISERQFRNAVNQFNQATEVWKVDSRLAELIDARANNLASGTLERVAAHATTIADQLRRFQAYAQSEQAYGKIQATLGWDLLPETVPTTDIHELSSQIANRINRLDSVEPVSEKPQVPVSSVSETTGSKDRDDDIFTRFTRWFGAYVAPSHSDVASNTSQNRDAEKSGM